MNSTIHENKIHSSQNLYPVYCRMGNFVSKYFRYFSENDLSFDFYFRSFTSLTSTGRQAWHNLAVMFECTRFDIHVHTSIQLKIKVLVRHKF